MGKEINTGIIHKGTPLSSEQITQLERNVLEQMASIAYINEQEELCFALPVDVNNIKSFAWSTANQLTVEEGVFTKKVYTRTGIDTFDHTLTLTKTSIDDVWGGGETPDEPVVMRAAGLYETGTDNMVASWDELLANGNIILDNGVVSNGSEPFELPNINEYGFYYGVMYTLQFDEGMVAGLILNEDGSFGAYTNGQLDNEFPAGSAIYADHSVDLTVMGFSVCQVSDDGKTIMLGEMGGFSLIEQGMPYNITGDLVLPNDGTITAIGNIEYDEDWNMVGDHAGFAYCENLTGITIPSSVTTICDSAFDCCHSLTSIEIPEGVTRIGMYAFYECNIATLVVPDSVAYIGEGAFSSCYNLTSVKLSSGMTVIADWLFANCESLTSISIPAEVRSIGQYAFEYCSSLNNIEIPQGVDTIGERALAVCSSLQSIVFDGTKAQWDAINFGYDYDYRSCYTIYFNDGTSYEKVKSLAYSLNDDGQSYSLTGRGDYSSDDIVNLVIPDTYKNLPVTSIGSSAFEACTSLTSVVVPNSVTSIGQRAFYYCSSLTEITLPFVGASKDDTTNTHFGYIFGAPGYSSNSAYVPSSLNKVTITSATNISANAFYNCSSLTSVVVPDSIVSIGESAFYGCSGLTNITIPDSITSIGSQAFYGCNSLTDLYISDIAKWCNISFATYTSNPMEFAANVYVNGQLVTDIVIPNSVTKISSYAFQGSGVANITIPSSVTEICSYAFQSCTGLTSVVVPESVTSIGLGAFSGCKMKEMTLPFVGATKGGTKNTFFGYIFGATSYSSNSARVPSTLAKVIVTAGTFIDDYAFYWCSYLKTVILPDSVKYLGNSAFSTSGVESVVFGNGISSLGNKIFYGCSSLKSVVIPDSVTYTGSETFRNCTGLTSVVIGPNVKSIGSHAFNSCSSLTSVVIPDSVTEIDTHAFYRCGSLTSVVIGDRVTTIGDYAFSNCSTLTDVYYKGTEEAWASISIDSSNTYLTNATIHYNYQG